MTLTTMLLTVALAIAIAALYATYRWGRSLKNSIRNTTAAYSLFDPSRGMQSAIDTIAEYMRAAGTKIYNSLLLTREDGTLRPQNDAITVILSEKSSAVKAFYTITPRMLDERYDTDKKFIERYGKKTWLIPVAKTPNRPCWKEHGCKNDLCPCNGTDIKRCWLQSDKNHHHEKTIKTYREKERKCLRCPSFLPLALLVGSGNSINTATTSANELFGPLLKVVDNSIALAHHHATDPLTGVASQAELTRHLDALYESCKAHDIPLSAYAFEVDNPGGLTDYYGTQAVQSIVAQTVDIARSSLRKADLCARMSADSTVYIVLLPNTEKKEAIELADRLREDVSNAEYKHNDKEGVERSLIIRISAGVSEIHTDETETSSDLIRDAYTALYNAKTHKNKVLPYTNKLQAPPEKKNHLDNQATPKKKSSASLRDIIKT